MYKLLSHNDLDGVGCGILARLAFDKDIEVRYNSIAGLNRAVESFFEKDNPETFLFITDLSVNDENEKRIEEFHQGGGKVQLIDHHKTSLEYNRYDWGHVVVEDERGKLTSATSLFYEYLITQGHLHPTTALNEFVELVRQYDTWEWEKNNNQLAHRLNSLFYLVSIEEFEENMIDRLKTEEHFHFDEFEKRILDMEDEKIERYIRRKRRELVQAQIKEHFAGIVYAESYHSELGNELGKDYPHLDYIAILNPGGKKLGFRTIHDNVDVSEVAAQFGGGGHAKASGCPLNEEAFRLFIAETFHLEPLHEDAKHNRFNTKESSYGTLYRNQKNDRYRIFPKNEKEWIIEKNKQPWKETFSSFAEAEKHLKRTEAAWLVKDEQFVEYLIEEARKK